VHRGDAGGGQDLIRNLLKTNPSERLGAGHRKKQHKNAQVLAQEWGDAMPIKTHLWFRGLRWDRVFSQQIQPSFVPDLQDDYDLTYFDREFTKDTTWKTSEVVKSLSLAEEHPNDAEDFSGFAYVAKAHPIKSPGAHKPSMFIGQQKVPRVSLEKARPTTAELAEAARTQRKSVSSHGRLDEEGEDGAARDEMTAAEAQLHRGSLDLPPWTVAGDRGGDQVPPTPPETHIHPGCLRCRPHTPPGCVICREPAARGTSARRAGGRLSAGRVWWAQRDAGAAIQRSVSVAEDEDGNLSLLKEGEVRAGPCPLSSLALRPSRYPAAAQRPSAQRASEHPVAGR
jgi:hypothetical protein